MTVHAPLLPVAKIGIVIVLAGCQGHRKRHKAGRQNMIGRQGRVVHIDHIVAGHQVGKIVVTTAVGSNVGLAGVAQAVAVRVYKYGHTGKP